MPQVQRRAGEQQGAFSERAKAIASIGVLFAIERSDDGQLMINTNLAENALCGVSLGRKNWVFVGSAKGSEHAAIFHSQIETCRLNGIHPQA